MRVLLIEDDAEDASAIVDHLERAHLDVDAKRVADEQAFKGALADGADLVVAEFEVGGFGALPALDILAGATPRVPLIVATSAVAGEAAAECIKRGAHDLVDKGHLDRLPSSVKGALEAARLRRQQSALVELGNLSISGATPAELSDRAVELVAEALDIELVSLLLQREEDDDLLVVSGVGWDEGVVGGTIVDGAHGSRVAGIGGSEAAVVIPDYTVLPDAPEVLLRHGVTTGIATRLRVGNDFFGLLAAHSRSLRTFTDDEAGFVRAVANRVSSTIWSHRAQEEITLRGRMIDVTGVAVYSLGLDGGVQRWGPGAERTFGWTEEEVVGKNILDLAVLTSDVALAGEIMEGLAEGERWEGEWLLRRKGGRVVPAHISASPNRDRQGTVIGIIVLAVDLTDRKQMEDAVRRSEERFRSLVQNSRDVIAVIDPAGEFSYVSPAVEEIAGYEPEELVGTSAFEFVHPDDLGQVSATFDELSSAEGATTMVEVRTRHKDGSWIWIEIRAANHGHDPGIQGMVLNYHDITERKRAEKVIRDSESLKSAILETTPDSVITMDDKGRIIDLNSAAERTFGYTRAEALGQDLATLIEPVGHQDLLREGIQRYLSTGESKMLGRRRETEARRKDGSTFPIEIAINQVSASDAPVFTGFVRDLSEQKTAEQAREKLEGQFRQSQKMEAVGRLAGGIAHDFNNILAVIINYAAFLREEIAPADPRLADVEEIASAAERAAKLVRQLLAFSRKEITQPQIIDLNTVMADMETLLHRTIGEDITLDFKASADLWPTKADPAQVEQILLNLAVNARDAMPDGGRLVVHTGNVAADAVMASQKEGFVPGEYACLTVSDTGSGMAPEIVAQIFEPFFTTKPRGEGTGLGLATVYGAVKHAGGYISVYSEPGVGTTFRVYFPRAEEGEIATARAPRVAAARGGSERILVVEDEDAVRELVQRILSRAGYDVMLANAATEALELAEREGGVDLLLTDVIMPEMSGKALSDEVTKRGSRCSTLFMSGYTDEIVASQGVLSEGELFVQKPFNAEGLLRKVREALDKVKR